MDDPKNRKDDVVVAELLRLIHSLMGDFRSQAAAIVEVNERLADGARKLDLLLAAFPEGGLVQHRLDHERSMASDKSARLLREGVTRNVISGGAWATILVVAYALWDYMKAHIK